MFVFFPKPEESKGPVSGQILLLNSEQVVKAPFEINDSTVAATNVIHSQHARHRAWSCNLHSACADMRAHGNRF